jgi:hypothetical protein
MLGSRLLAVAVLITLRFKNIRTGKGTSEGIRMQRGDQVSEAYDTPNDIGVLRLS